MSTESIVVRYFAGARAAAGTDAEPVTAATLDTLVCRLGQVHGERLAAILPACSFLVDGLSWRDRHTPFPPGATVDVLPPFAGG